MEFLFNSKGQHIANFVNGQLHSKNGKNIGHYLGDYKIFIDMNGRYLGEIINSNRLLRNRNSNYGSVSFGIYGNYGNPGNCGSMGIISGFEDIPVEVLE